MDVSRVFLIAAVALCVTGSSIVSLCQPTPNSFDPATRQTAAKPPDGFVDFTLKRINPADQDYGKCFDQGRDMLLAESVKNGYFWSNLVALGLLGFLFLIVLYQHRIQTRRDWTAAGMLAQHKHASARMAARMEEVTQENRNLIEDLAAVREAALRPGPSSEDSLDRRASAAVRGRTATVKAAIPATGTLPAKLAAERNVRTATVVEEPQNQMALFKPDATLIMRVNSLEQQLARSEEQRKELGRQLNDAGRKLQVEQEKNRALKGA
jgi:hypothetical protein